MKKTWVLLFSVLLTLTISGTRLNAKDRKFVKAVIVDNREHTKILPLRVKATDAPPTATEYDHDIYFKVGCTMYAVRYRTELDYLPPGLDPGETIEVSPEKHLVYAKIPGNRDARMSIVSQSNLTGNACAK